MLSELEQKEFAKILEFQAMQENTIWMIEGEGETLDGMKVVKAMIENRKVYSVPKKDKV
jgi:phage protein U